MSAFENDFEPTEALPGEPSPEPTPAEEVNTALAAADQVEDEEIENDEDDFFTENAAAAVPEIDPATVITIRTSAGADKFVEAPAPLPLVDAIAKSGLRFNGDYTCWLNGQEVPLGTTVAGGMTVTVVGSVKGGA